MPSILNWLEARSGLRFPAGSWATAKVEIKENIGKIIAIDIETGEYSIDNDVIATSRNLLAKRPNAATWTKKIGYNAVYAVGGTLSRTAK